MSDRSPFRVAFFDGEPSSAARQAAADGFLELISAAEADPDRVDGVVIDGRPALRAERIAKYLCAGVAVLASAPSVAIASEHDRLVETAEAVSGRLLTAYRQRWRPEVTALAGAIAAGELGSIGLVRMHTWSVGRHSWRAADPDPELRDAVDTVLWLSGTAPQVVYAAGDDAYVQAHIGFAGGGMALLDLATLPVEPYEALTVIGSDGAAHADDHHNVQLLYDRSGLRGLPLRGDAERALLRAFTGGAASVAAAERVVSAVTDAILRSLTENVAIELELSS